MLCPPPPRSKAGLLFATLVTTSAALLFTTRSGSGCAGRCGFADGGQWEAKVEVFDVVRDRAGAEAGVSIGTFVLVKQVK